MAASSNKTYPILVWEQNWEQIRHAEKVYLGCMVLLFFVQAATAGLVAWYLVNGTTAVRMNGYLLQSNSTLVIPLIIGFANLAFTSLLFFTAIRFHAVKQQCAVSIHALHSQINPEGDNFISLPKINGVFLRTLIYTLACIAMPCSMFLFKISIVTSFHQSLINSDIDNVLAIGFMVLLIAFIIAVFFTNRANNAKIASAIIKAESNHIR